MVEKIRAEVARLLTVEIRSRTGNIALAFVVGLVTGVSFSVAGYILIQVLGLTKLVGLLWR